jgi:hypothetical protein
LFRMLLSVFGGLFFVRLLLRWSNCQMLWMSR